MWEAAERKLWQLGVEGGLREQLEAVEGKKQAGEGEEKSLEGQEVAVGPLWGLQLGLRQGQL